MAGCCPAPLPSLDDSGIAQVVRSASVPEDDVRLLSVDGTQAGRATKVLSVMVLNGRSNHKRNA